MKLHPWPFNAIRSGEKTIEIRLNDEKRQQINIGDRIILEKRPDFTEKVTVAVTSLTKYKSFSDLYDGPQGKGLGESKKVFLEKIRQYYSEEEEKQYGVVVIGIELERGEAGQ